MNKMLKIMGLCLIFTTICIGQKMSTKDKMHGFEAQVDSLMSVFHTVGASVAIIKDGQTVYAQDFGYRDLEKKIPADENTIYGIGSCTKAFTASLFGILEEQGRLSLEDKPGKYIPDLAFFSEEMDADIKIKHILSHSTGMPSTSTESSAVLFTSEDKNEVIPRLKYLQPQ